MRGSPCRRRSRIMAVSAGSAARPSGSSSGLGKAHQPVTPCHRHAHAALRGDRGRLVVAGVRHGGSRPCPDRWSARVRACSAASSVPSATQTWPAWIDRPMPTAAAVVNGHPGGAGSGVDERVQDRPVGDRVRAVGHRLGLAVGRATEPRRGGRGRSRSARSSPRDQLVEAQAPGAARRSPASRSARAVPGSAPSPRQRIQRASARRRGTPRARPRRWRRCPPGRRTAPPSGTAPSPRRTAAGCTRERSPG